MTPKALNGGNSRNKVVASIPCWLLGDTKLVQRLGAGLVFSQTIKLFSRSPPLGVFLPLSRPFQSPAQWLRVCV